MKKGFENLANLQKIAENPSLDIAAKALLDEICSFESFENALLRFPNRIKEISEILGMRLICLEGFIADEKCCLLMPYEIAHKLKTFAYSISQNKITLITLEPFDSKNIQLIKELIKHKYPSFAIEFALVRLGDFYAHLQNLKIQEQIHHQSEISNLYALIIENAISQKASDIHLESKAHYGSFKIRQDGKIKEIAHIKAELFESLCNKIKLESKLDISEKRLPQDGRCAFVAQGVRYDLRISCMPTQHGESIVIRILDTTREEITLNSLHLSTQNLTLIKKLLQAPCGIILIAGPTGSGKSTTLYAMLEALKSTDKKLITIEDPIEYQINLATQIQINPDYGFGFSEALRAILRQDPDVIMVGEIRDKQTLQLAIQASLTGHLVLSTIHTNDSISTIDRLMNMGVESYLLSSSLLGIISQRLVRKLCPRCKTPSKEPIEISSKKIENPYFGSGCKDCNMQGVLGREALMEVLEITPELRKIISKNHLEIPAYLKNTDFRTFFDDGITKAQAGSIPAQEIYSVVKIQ